MFSPPKISWVVSGIKYICLHSLTVFYLIQPSSNQIICFDFRKQNSVLPIVFYVPWKKVYTKSTDADTPSNNFYDCLISEVQKCHRGMGLRVLDRGLKLKFIVYKKKAFAGHNLQVKALK